MKKAAIYARVSSEQQREKRTIDSQILALKKQVAEAGDVLVKEYVDDGYSGARLDRPGLDQLRKDLKTGLFDTVYFHNADRIARDASHQTIIIAEMLKNRKQIIINGKDYVHNPENKFTLTVLGAVAELERAKIVERASRGRAMRLSQGQLVGSGHNTYGYDYIRRTPSAPPKMVINKREAEVVRSIFAEYAKGRVGMTPITRRLEDEGVRTKSGKKLWRKSFLKHMLNNETYVGVRHFNTMRRIREYANPLFGIKHSSSKMVKRDRSEWVGVKVPAIVTQAVFDKVQERLAENRTRYRNPKRVQLLSSLIRCGECGGSFYAYRRYYRKVKKSGEQTVVHRVSYCCNWRLRQAMHSKKSDIKLCHNTQVKAGFLEAAVFWMIEETLLDPKKLRGCMDFFREKGRAAQLKLEKRLKAIETDIERLASEKKRVLDIYASGHLAKEDYVKKSLRYDNEINELKRRRSGLVGRIPLLHKTEVIDTSISQFCEAARVRFRKCVEFVDRRQFLLDHIEKVVFLNDKVSLYGAVPVNAKKETNDECESATIEYRIDGRVVRPSKSG